MSAWTIFYLGMTVAGFLVCVIILRWAFRVNEQIQLLKQIVGELRRLNTVASPNPVTEERSFSDPFTVSVQESQTDLGRIAGVIILIIVILGLLVGAVLIIGKL